MTRMKPSSRPLSRTFFDRPADRVARDLLGSRLVVRGADGRLTRHVVVETEAYLGAHDLACHAARGMTPRNAVMFGPAGVWYVYLCYGMHWMLNVVTGPRGVPAAVLIRGVGDHVGHVDALVGPLPDKPHGSRHDRVVDREHVGALPGDDSAGGQFDRDRGRDPARQQVGEQSGGSAADLLG